MVRFSDGVARTLGEAGWTPGRQVSTLSWEESVSQSGLVIHNAFKEFLGEFGGIRVEVHGTGISLARAPFEFNPEKARGDEDRFIEWSEFASVLLCPIGSYDERWNLGIDEHSVIYIVGEALARYGPVERALAMLVLGEAPVRLD
jgi:hypothetical protein